MRYRAPIRPMERNPAVPAVSPCPHLAAIVAAVEDADPGLLDRLGIGRRRRRCGGRHGTCYLEQAGPSPDGTYLELTLHHREAERQVWAALVAYRPLARGGQVVDLGSLAWAYREGADEVNADVATTVRRWLVAHAASADTAS